MGPQNLLSLRFLTHSIFAFEKEVSWRDRKKSYNRYFTAALPHPSSRIGETGKKLGGSGEGDIFRFLSKLHRFVNDSCFYLINIFTGSLC